MELLSFYINNKTISINLVRKGASSMKLTIDDNRIVVYAGKLIPKTAIKKWVEPSLPRFIKALDKIKKSVRIDIDKGFVFMHGNKLSIESLTGFVKPSLMIKGKTIYIKTKLGNDEEMIELIKKYMREWTSKEATKIQRKYEKLMNAPKHEIKVSYRKSTWGWNKIKEKVISYNTRLAHFSPDNLEATVVHELAHHFVRNHNKEFYSIINKYFPNYKKVEYSKWTNNE